ncbi:50S ribosomal protein L22 [Candidatus Woesearchaeota archaeon]|nr:50S ribosomal protein L22 [Candidatus Woesearchaeota archaeon]
MAEETVAAKSEASASGVSLQISTKACVELANAIRKKTTGEAKALLTRVITKQQAVPYRIFIKELSHKKGTGPGRFPKKSAQAIIEVIENAEANAQFKGLNTSNLEIVHIKADAASRPWRFGRRRRRSKRTTIEIKVKEKPKEEPKKSAPKVQK